MPFLSILPWLLNHMVICILGAIFFAIYLVGFQLFGCDPAKEGPNRCLLLFLENPGHS
jgi:hypothetical protein